MIQADKKSIKDDSFLLILGFSSFWIWLLLNRGTLVNIGGLSLSDSPVYFSIGIAIFIVVMLGLAFFQKIDRIWLVMKWVFIFLVVLTTLLSSFSYGIKSLIEPTAALLSILQPGLFIIWFSWLISNHKSKLVALR